MVCAAKLWIGNGGEGWEVEFGGLMHKKARQCFNMFGATY